MFAVNKNLNSFKHGISRLAFVGFETPDYFHVDPMGQNTLHG
jgi:hypothetical protein